MLPGTLDPCCGRKERTMIELTEEQIQAMAQQESPLEVLTRGPRKPIC